MVKKKVKRKIKKTKVKKTNKKKVIRKRTPRLASLARGEKIIAKVDHFFGHISVAAFKLKSPLKVGDTIHIKGHTTDFTQTIDSMQKEHKNILKAKKGNEIGIKVKAKVRIGDTVYLAAKEKGITAQPSQPAKPSVIQPPIFPGASLTKKPPQLAQPTKPAQLPPPPPQQQKKDPYSDVKFFRF